MEDDEAAYGRAPKENDGPPRSVTMHERQRNRRVQQRPPEADPSLAVVCSVALEQGPQVLDVVRVQRPRLPFVRLHLGVPAVLARQVSSGEERREDLGHGCSRVKRG